MSDDLSGLSLVELYDRLVMPDAPVAVSLWPQTAGWVWLGLGLLVALAVIGRVATLRHRARAYRRAALVALERAGDDPAAIADILRRTALAGFPRRDVAGLSGDAWLGFLDASAPAAGFSGTEAGRILASAPYRDQPPHSDLPRMAAAWVRTHRRQGARG